MARIPTVKARDEFSDLVNRAAYGKERVVLTRRGKALAAVVPLEDVELLERLEDRIDLDEARAALAEVRDDGTVSWEEIKAEIGL
ncbi:MAG: type II toxin-antitoxin system Phd/YefM family antitoxin [Rhodospirillales bacterium]